MSTDVSDTYYTPIDPIHSRVARNMKSISYWQMWEVEMLDTTHKILISSLALTRSTCDGRTTRDLCLFGGGMVDVSRMFAFNVSFHEGIITQLLVWHAHNAVCSLEMSSLFVTIASWNNSKPLDQQNRWTWTNIMIGSGWWGTNNWATYSSSKWCS